MSIQNTNWLSQVKTVVLDYIFTFETLPLFEWRRISGVGYCNTSTNAGWPLLHVPVLYQIFPPQQANQILEQQYQCCTLIWLIAWNLAGLEFGLTLTGSMGSTHLLQPIWILELTMGFVKTSLRITVLKSSSNSVLLVLGLQGSLWAQEPVLN